MNDMKVLITSAASELAGELAVALSAQHQVRLTDIIDVQTDYDFVRNDLGHGEETGRLVEGMDAIVHLGELADSTLAAAPEVDNLLIDYATRSTYNLLQAACEEKVTHVIYASSLRLFDRHDESWAVNEVWRPGPTTEANVLAKYAGEFVCREFAREGSIRVTCLRLGKLIKAGEVATNQLDSTWLEMGDAVQAFECALRYEAPGWSIYHIQSEFPGSRFSIDKAKEELGYNPQFTLKG